MVLVTLPDGTPKEIEDGATYGDVAASTGSRLAKDAAIAVANDVEVDLSAKVKDGVQVSIATYDSELGLKTLRHSAAHILAQAVLELWPGATFAIGPPIEDGFYYDFDLGEGNSFFDSDLEKIEAKMRQIVDADQPFERIEVNPKEASALMAKHRYKLEIIDQVVSGERTSDFEAEADGDSISFYRNTEEFVDMCVGPHIASTSKLQHFKLMRFSGSYWRGDEKGPQLQRIYGTAWASKKQLAEHLNRLEEAAKRDHRMKKSKHA